MAVTQQSGAERGAPSALRDVLAQIVRRLRLAAWIRLASRGALIAVCLSLLAVGLAHAGLLPPWLPLEVAVPLLLLLGISLGTLFAARHPVDPMTAARLVESRLGLKERLSSALEFARAGTTPPDPEAVLLLRLQEQDAAAYARALQPADAVPLRLPWETKAFLAAFLLLMLALILPALPVFVPPSVRAERAVVQRSGEELARAARVIEKRADAQGLPATKHAAQNMRKLGERMAQGRMDKKQAMVQMARLSKQMADEQRRLAQTGRATPQDGQGLAQAGRTLAQSLAQPAPGQGARPATGTGGKNSLAQGHNPTTPEMQKAAQSLKRGSVPGLSEQLRNLAQRSASRPMSPDEQRQAAQDLQKLSDALKGTPLTDARKHAQSAAEALKRGDSPRAASEMRQAADRQAKPPQDAQGVQDAQKSLQSGEQQMAQASTPAEIPHGASAQPPPEGAAGSANPQGAGNSASREQSHGKPGAAGQNSPGGRPPGGMPSSLDGGIGKSAPTTPGAARAQPATGQVQQTPPQNSGVVRGAPHPLDPRFDPTRNPKYGKIFLGAGDGDSGGSGKRLKSQSATPPGEPRASSVPYYNSLAPARQTAETAMDKEDIPPAYRSSVRRYFDSLQPPAGKPSK